MNLATALILLVIVVAVVLAVRSIVRDQKKGCSGCSGCGSKNITTCPKADKLVRDFEERAGHTG